jgi:FkbM family methyltransferase
MGIRANLFSVIWPLLWPVRIYLTRFPIQRGKGLVQRWLLVPLLPPNPNVFETRVPGGAKLQLLFRETIGLSTLLHGGFETAEVTFARAHFKPSSTFMDVGANAGLYSVALAGLANEVGQIMAFEPLTENLERLHRNIALNGFTNVKVFPFALGDRDGTVDLKLATDPGYHSIAEVSQNRGLGQSRKVILRRLDSVWRENGSAEVSLIKIDVEGAEPMVLEGARELIATCRPMIMVEANTSEHLDRLKKWFEAYSYQPSQPPGFKPWNYVFSSIPAVP